MADYSDGALLVWHVAAMEAARAEYPQIEAAHFLLACCKLCDVPMEEALQGARESVQRRASLIETEIEELQRVFLDVGLQPTPFRRKLRKAMGILGMSPADSVMHRSPELKRACLRAERYVEAIGGAFVFPIHLLLHLAENQEEATWEPILAEVGLKAGALFAAVRHAVRQRDGLPGDLRIAVDRGRERELEAVVAPEEVTPIFDGFGTDLSRMAREGLLPCVVGRRDKIKRLARILIQQSDNCAILVGEAGVGKTSIVLGLAQAMAARDALPALRRKRIVEISVAALVARAECGTEFEERLAGLLDEARDPDTILYCEDIGLLLKEGGATALTRLTAALARGVVRCIASATTEEYDALVATAPALTRCFTRIVVEEPTEEETMLILRAACAALAAHHQLEITEDALLAAVELSVRFAPEERLPRKAKRLLDSACARVRLRSFRRDSFGERVEADDVVRVAEDRYGKS